MLYEVITSPEPNFFKITIENEYDPYTKKSKGEGIGLRNIRQRLELIYGNPSYNFV